MGLSGLGEITNYGQLGDNTITGHLEPVQTHILTDVDLIAAAKYGHSLALKSDGSVWAWGNNNFGQIGDNTTTGHLEPVQTHNITDAIAIAAGNGHSLAVKDVPSGVEENANRKVQNDRLEIYPNPSFGNTVIKYGLPKKASISLRLYNVSGRLVKTIYSGAQEKGYYEVDIKQDEMKGGIYFIRFETDKFKATRKLTILK